MRHPFVRLTIFYFLFWKNERKLVTISEAQEHKAHDYFLFFIFYFSLYKQILTQKEGSKVLNVADVSL
jgi:hypothetical protein